MACTIDFWCLDEEFGGKTYKHKRQPPADDLSSMHIDPNSNPNLLPLPPLKCIAVPSIDDPDKPSPAPAAAAAGAPTYDGVILRRVSGRKWKQPWKNWTSAVRVPPLRSVTSEGRRRGS